MDTQRESRVAVGVVAAEGKKRHKGAMQIYPYWFFVPAAVLFTVFFVVPTVYAFYFSLTRWTLFDAEFIGFSNYVDFLSDSQLSSGLVHTIFYAIVTSGLKVIISLPLAFLLTSALALKTLFRSIIFFPVLVSTVAVGITFSILMQPTTGLINTWLRVFGISGPDWLGDPNMALFSVALVDVWKGLGIATVICIAGIMAIPRCGLPPGTWTSPRGSIPPRSTRPSTRSIISWGSSA